MHWIILTIMAMAMANLAHAQHNAWSNNTITVALVGIDPHTPYFGSVIGSDATATSILLSPACNGCSFETGASQTTPGHQITAEGNVVARETGASQITPPPQTTAESSATGETGTALETSTATLVPGDTSDSEEGVMGILEAMLWAIGGAFIVTFFMV